MSSRTHVPALPACLFAIAVAGCTSHSPTGVRPTAISVDLAAPNGCSNVSGAIIGQFTSPTTAVGTFTGDIAGTFEAFVDGVQPSGAGALHLKTHGTITTTTGNQISFSGTSEGNVLAPTDPPQYGANATFNLIGGTGIYANVSGELRTHGDADLATGTVSIRYDGRVCLGS